MARDHHPLHRLILEMLWCEKNAEEGEDRWSRRNDLAGRSGRSRFWAAVDGVPWAEAALEQHEHATPFMLQVRHRKETVDRLFPDKPGWWRRRASLPTPPATWPEPIQSAWNLVLPPPPAAVRDMFALTSTSPPNGGLYRPATREDNACWRWVYMGLPLRMVAPLKRGGEDEILERAARSVRGLMNNPCRLSTWALDASIRVMVPGNFLRSREDIRTGEKQFEELFKHWSRGRTRLERAVAEVEYLVANPRGRSSWWSRDAAYLWREITRSDALKAQFQAGEPFVRAWRWWNYMKREDDDGKTYR